MASESGARVIHVARAAGVLALGLGLTGAAAHASPGALTSAPELAAIRAAADAGTSPQKDYRTRVLTDAREAWAWGSVSGEYGTTVSSGSKKCHPLSNPAGADYLLEGAPDAYAQVLGAHLAGDPSLAQQARAHVLDLVDTSGFRGLTGDYSGDNQCALDLALSIPVWIETARLLADTSVWSAADSTAFRGWLASQVYPKVAWASRVRRNNWGAAGSLAAYTIARYVDGAVATLAEVSPAQLTLSPGQAAAAHAAMQLSRIGSTWVGDAQCAKRGIQWHGGIPEELRRGSTGCDGTYLVANDSSRTYQMMHVELLVFHAEAMRRNGDLALYQAKTSQGAPAILQAILFVIANPTGQSWPWEGSRWGTLITAASFYDNATLATLARSDSTFRGGRTLPYTRLTARPYSPTTTAGTPVSAPGKPYIVH
jgi:hypothetical protein